MARKKAIPGMISPADVSSMDAFTMSTNRAQ